MQVQDCPWEIENIGKKTVQLNYSKEDIYNSEEVKKAVEGYQYLVAKVPTGNISCLLGLQDDGFKMIETQLSLSKKKKDFNFDDPLLRIVEDGFVYRIVKTDMEVSRVLDLMTPFMFTTDRVSIDPEFGPEVGLHRYKNWICSEIKRGGILTEWIKNGNSIGFGLYRIDGMTNHGLLGGIFEGYQKEGFGILTAAGNLLFPATNGYDEVKRCKTAISSNNLPVLNFYNYLNFKVDGLENVLVKHQ